MNRTPYDGVHSKEVGGGSTRSGEAGARSEDAREGNTGRKAAGIVEPDTLLPIQYFEAMRRKHLLEGEKRLVLSVLEDAVECFMKCIDSSTNKGQRLFRDAEEWINLEDKKWVFSFDNVCEMLDVNPEYLRRGLREWKVRKLDTIERARIARAEQAALSAIQPAVAEVEAPVAKVEIVKPVARAAAKPVAAPALGRPASVTSALPIITSIAPRPTPST